MVGLPPQYPDREAGVGLLVLLAGVLTGVLISRLTGLHIPEPAGPVAAVFAIIVAAMTPLHLRYRHVVAGALVLTLLVGAFVVTAHRLGSLVPLTASASTPGLVSTDTR